MYKVPEDDPEVKINISANVARSVSGEISILTHLELRKSKQKDLMRIMAWVHKVFSKVRWSQPLLLRDINTAELTLLRMIQREAFQEELSFYGQTTGTTPKAMRKGKGNIWRLDPFVHSIGLHRVGRRIRKSIYPYADRDPIIIPKGSIAVK